MDDLLLTTPAGSVLNVGSWLRADPGPDFGEKGLLEAFYSTNPKTEGGALAYERVGVRRMSFPLLLASGAAGALTTVETLLRHGSREGATLDVKPAGVATADAIRFDVLAGRWEPAYNVRHQEVSRRLGDLHLDVAPFGYSPTWILLASAASVGLPGTLTIPAGSILGDAPGLIRFSVEPSLPANATLVGTWLPDVIGWGLGARASFTSVLRGASMTAAMTASSFLAARAESQAGTVLNVYLSPTHAGWTTLAYYDVPAAVEPAYRGRYRAFAYVRQDANLQGGFNALHLSLDAVNALNPSLPMASAARIATLAAQPLTTLYTPQLLDLGEITLPPEASGIARGIRLRVWGNKATYAGNANSSVDLDAVCLLPLDGGAGFLPRGLAWPQIQTATLGRFAVDAREKTVLVGVATGDLASTLPVEDAFGRYRGVFPHAGPSTVGLHLVAGARRRDKGEDYLQAVLADSPYAYYRLDEPAGSPTLADSSGNERHGTYVGAPSLAQPGLLGEPSGNSVAFSAATQYGMLASGVHVPLGTTFTVEFWARRNSGDGGDLVVGNSHKPNPLIPAPYQCFAIGWSDSDSFVVSFSGGTAILGASAVDADEVHHWVCRYQGGSRICDIFRDSILVASAGNASRYVNANTYPFYIGVGPPEYRHPFAGQLDELAMYATQLPSARVRAHYLAGAVSDALVARPAQAHAAAALHYQPRFLFLKAGI